MTVLRDFLVWLSRLFPQLTHEYVKIDGTIDAAFVQNAVTEVGKVIEASRTKIRHVSSSTEILPEGEGNPESHIWCRMLSLSCSTTSQSHHHKSINFSLCVYADSTCVAIATDLIFLHSWRL
jgi:hypothetical protein